MIPGSVLKTNKYQKKSKALVLPQLWGESWCCSRPVAIPVLGPRCQLVALRAPMLHQGLGEPCPGPHAVSPGTGWCRAAGTTSGCGESGAERCARVPSIWASTIPWSSPTWPSRRGTRPSGSRRTARCKGLLGCAITRPRGSLPGGSSTALAAFGVLLPPPLRKHGLWLGVSLQNTAASWSWESLSPPRPLCFPKEIQLLAG